MDDVQREKLKGIVDEFDEAIAKIDKAAEPLDHARNLLQAHRDRIVEEAGVEIVGTCEGCDRLLIAGDMGHPCVDGPILCHRCAPSYADVRKQALERQGEGDEDAGLAVAAIDAHVAEGGSLEDPAVYPL